LKASVPKALTSFISPLSAIPKLNLTTDTY
jgi:hypothetical protein